MDDGLQPRTGWTFLTNHARVLAAIARDPGVRVRDIASSCLLTERAVQKIIADLEADGYLSHTRSGRSNQYEIPEGTVLRHPADAGPTVGDLLAMLAVHDDGNASRRDGAGHDGAGHNGAAHDGDGQRGGGHAGAGDEA